MTDYRNPFREILSAVDDAGHHWDLTREFPDKYEEWQYEASNGNTLLGFRDWLKDNEEESDG